MGKPKNLVGMRFGKLTVIRKTDFRKNNKIMWECKCDCGNNTYAATGSLTSGNTKTCGCSHPIYDITGKKFGNLTVLHRDKEKPRNWKCICDCGTEASFSTTALMKRRVNSCGCLRTINEYIIKSDYVECLVNGEKSFYFDLSDIKLVKHYKWNIDNLNYVISYLNNCVIKLHNIIMNPTDDLVVDHINRNPLDNRRKNLRTCSRGQNAINRSKGRNNTSGHLGVSYNKRNNKWVAYITSNGKQIYLGLYDKKEDAIKVRLEAEIKYRGEFRQSLLYSN